MQTKNIFFAGGITLVVVLLVAIVGGALVDSITNNNSGTADNPPEPELYLDVFYDGVNKTDGSTVDWGTWTVGANSKTLTISNKGVGFIQVFVYISNAPVGWTFTFNSNGTSLNTGQQVQDLFTVTVPDTVVDGQQYSFTATVVADA